MTVEIKENGKTFFANIDRNFSGDQQKVVWTRWDLSRKFRYVRCEFCGKMIAQRSAGWYSHFQKHLDTDVKVIAE